jgi:hypothetical protein
VKSRVIIEIPGQNSYQMQLASTLQWSNSWQSTQQRCGHHCRRSHRSLRRRRRRQRLYRVIPLRSTTYGPSDVLRLQESHPRVCGEIPVSGNAGGRNSFQRSCCRRWSRQISESRWKIQFQRSDYYQSQILKRPKHPPSLWIPSPKTNNTDDDISYAAIPKLSALSNLVLTGNIWLRHVAPLVRD